MVIRQVFPFGFEPSVRRTPPHIRLAVGVSIAIHAVAIGYLAYAKFNPPSEQQAEDPPIVMPWVELVKPKPDKPMIEKPAPRLHPPISREIPQVDPVPAKPLILEDPPKPFTLAETLTSPHPPD